MSISIGTKLLTKPPKQKSKTHLKNHTFKKKLHKTLLNSIICQISCDDTLSKASEKGKCTLFKAVGLRKDDVHRRLHDEFQSNGAVIERVFTQIDSDVLTEHRQRHSFVLQLVQFFLNLFCLCSFHSRIYDTVSYQFSCDDTLSKASEKGKCTLFKAVGLRKDDVHRRLHDEFDSLDLIPTDRIQYHR
jgi:hypothetical protein